MGGDHLRPSRPCPLPLEWRVLPVRRKTNETTVACLSQPGTTTVSWQITLFLQNVGCGELVAPRKEPYMDFSDLRRVLSHARERRRVRLPIKPFETAQDIGWGHNRFSVHGRRRQTIILGQGEGMWILFFAVSPVCPTYCRTD